MKTVWSREELVAALAQKYGAKWSTDRMTIADLCNDELDPSGQLLGEVRAFAATLKTAER